MTSTVAAMEPRTSETASVVNVSAIVVNWNTRDLLAQTLNDSIARTWVIERQVTEQQLGPVLAEAIRAHLEQQDGESIASALIGGLTLDDLDIPVSSITSEIIVGATDFLLPPLPNHLFTRDTTCCA